MTLKQMLEQYHAKQDKLAAIFEEAKTEGGGDPDFTKVKSIEGATTMAKVEKVQQMQKELEGEWGAIEAQQKAEKTFRDLDGRSRTPAPGEGMHHPEPDENKDQGIQGQRIEKTFGQLLAKSDAYLGYVKSGLSGSVQFTIPDYGLRELKTLFQTSAGWAPESIRLPGFVEAVTTPPAVIDIIPSGTTGQQSIVYMEETTRTHAAAEKAEGTTFAESTFAFTQRTETVEKITDSIPVTDEQLEDVAMAESYLGDRLRFGLRQRLSSQCLDGDGATPNLLGIKNFTGIQSRPKGGDPTPDAIYKGMRLVRVTGRAEPTHIVMHPNDWESIRLLRTADGIYIWGNPSEAGPERMWGKPVIQTTEQTENTAIVGAFSSPYIMLFDRKGIDIQVGYTGTQFVEGKKTIRADLRAALIGFRGVAFCKVTGI